MLNKKKGHSKLVIYVIWFLSQNKSKKNKKTHGLRGLFEVGAGGNFFDLNLFAGMLQCKGRDFKFWKHAGNKMQRMRNWKLQTYCNHRKIWELCYFQSETKSACGIYTTCHVHVNQKKTLNRIHLEKSSKGSQKKSEINEFFGFSYIFICTKIREILCQYVENILLYSQINNFNHFLGKSLVITLKVLNDLNMFINCHFLAQPHSSGTR